MLSFEEIRKNVEKAISELRFDYPPQSLYAPIEYTLALGGKRIRPALVLMAYNLYKEAVEEAMAPAIGWKSFHNFTLLHDDLMDEADKRRNKPTVHKYGMLIRPFCLEMPCLIAAYQLIGKTPACHLKPVFDLFTQTALEICGGQQYDMEFETRTDVTEAEYIEMIRLKTAVHAGLCVKDGSYFGRCSGRRCRTSVSVWNSYRTGIPITG